MVLGRWFAMSIAVAWPPTSSQPDVDQGSVDYNQTNQRKTYGNAIASSNEILYTHAVTVQRSCDPLSKTHGGGKTDRGVGICLSRVAAGYITLNG
jgi:hypothetical protein